MLLNIRTWMSLYMLVLCLTCVGFRFIYKPAYVKNPNANCVNQREACWATTKYLQVSLVSTSDPNRVYKVSYTRLLTVIQGCR